MYVCVFHAAQFADDVFFLYFRGAMWVIVMAHQNLFVWASTRSHLIPEIISELLSSLVHRDFASTLLLPEYFCYYLLNFFLTTFLSLTISVSDGSVSADDEVSSANRLHLVGVMTRCGHHRLQSGS
jgi:hypothetical protein